MATTVVLPPISTLRSKPTAVDAFSSFDSISFSSDLSCGLDNRLSAVKTEMWSAEDSMDTCSTNTATYTQLSSVMFTQLKQGQSSDLYSGSGCEGRTSFGSWTTKHPEHWQSKEVLDWLFSLPDVEDFDWSLFRGEAYNSLTGKQLCNMTLADFIALDANYGASVYEIFQILLRDADFKKPSSPRTLHALNGNVPDFDFLECPSDVTPPQSPSPPVGSPLAVFLDHNGNEVVSLGGLGLYDVDLTLTTPQAFDQIDDSDYSSASEEAPDRSSSVSSEPMFTDEEDSSDIVIPDLTRHDPSSPSSPSSSSTDSGCESDDRRPTTGRQRSPNASKGNHLWEFVLGLLKEPLYNPSHVKWEDKEIGVFKFVQSEAVAKMWGRKKNNPGMTYEKLSRAMRFCRSAGYFANVPKTGRFPKKLCFKFGPKAHSWLD